MKAISPVIATVIIVAVAIAISIAVALWLTGIVGGFTTVENLQITYAYPYPVEKLSDNSHQSFPELGDSEGWVVILKVENKGTAAATIDYVFVNGQPLNTSDAMVNITQLTIITGKTETFAIGLKRGFFTSGQQVEIKLHTASGKEYPKMITLP